MSRQLQNVAHTYSKHAEVLDRVVSTVGMNRELSDFPVLELQEPIPFRRSGKTYTHLHPATYGVGGDHPGNPSPHDRSEVWISPQLSLLLLEEEVTISGLNKATGVVCRVDYMEFGLRAAEFADGSPNIERILTPRTYDVQKGTHFSPDENSTYEGGRAIPLGSERDQGDLARFASKVLTEAAVLLSAYSQEELLQF